MITAMEISSYAPLGMIHPVAKFVALAADINESFRAFGAHTKLGMTMTCGLAFTNDTGTTVSLYFTQQ